MIPRISTNSDLMQKSLLSGIEKSLNSALMRDVLCKILDLANLNMPVILIGEIGSGKKRMAQIIHENSSRASHPFYSFYCLDLTNEEYEEAFREQLHINNDHFILKYNIIEKASRGILYMDQFSELSADLILNFVQSFKKASEQLFRYSEAAKPRLILSVNMESYLNLVNMPSWQTILHMLDPYTIMIPPLRERKEDIPLLIDSIIEEIKSKSKKFRDLSISDAALDACSSYSWPGNIRQLNNALLQGAVLSHGKTIEKHHFPFSMNWKLPYEFE
jgi:DNA-binding NtrC family response regulator